ncbi:MAG: lipoxygenase family protein [Spirochaetota bacterium]
MPSNTSQSPYPCLPQNISDPKEREKRQFDLSLARTQYNYMFSYLEPVPLSASVPDGEGFSLDYQAKVVEVFLPIARNFKDIVISLLERELKGDLSLKQFAKIKESYKKLENEMSLNLVKDIKNLEEFLKCLAELPQDINELIKNLTDVPKDLEKMATGLEKVFGEFLESGPTAFLKSTIYEMLREEPGNDYVQAQNLQDYENLFDSLPKPMTLLLEQKPWMAKDTKAWEQDWYFGYLQIGGFNTTLLQGVKLEANGQKMTVILSDLLDKFPITDKIFQDVVGDSSLSLKKAAEQNRLYVCDYSMLDGAKAIEFHGQQRYMAAPIALFYWNPNPPEGYPSSDAAMQPIAIQLEQKFDPETTPIFTPNDCSSANDPNGLKWKIAKFVANTCQMIQHESVAHFGACHITVEPMVVAANRQLSEKHPLMKLLKPHFRFTIQINNSAIHSLVIPGGTVATGVGPAIEDTLKMVADAHEAWRFDENNPDRLFALRGVTIESLSKFPFRDDTVLLWQAIKKFVGGYVKTYYKDNNDVIEDTELQGWINEMVSPKCASIKGMDRLKKVDDSKKPYRIDSVDYLIDIVAQIIYIAGPGHAAVNYAQYPLMSYVPSVSGTIYNELPGKSTQIHSEEDCIKWYPPLDVSLYQSSFEYLLTMVQYDTFGYYDTNPRDPYFTEPHVNELVLDFQEELAQIEATIRKRNKERPVPYLFQIPSLIPNSISI